MFNFQRENSTGGGCGTQPFSPFKNPAIGNMEPIQPILKNEQNFDCLQNLKEVISSLQTYQVGANFEALQEGVFMAPLDSRYTQVGFNLFCVQV